MERLAQGKRSGTQGWVIVSKTIYALKGQKRGYCAFVSHNQCYVLIGLSARVFQTFSKCHVVTLLPFQGVDIIFLFHIPRVPLRLPWARRSIGLSARPWKSKIHSTPKFKSPKMNRLIFRYKSYICLQCGLMAAKAINGHEFFLCVLCSYVL